ncbi:MAG: EAL domain-containing protein [Burkholderiales bacterium]|nr:EAL domain-containing protein [Burkholderiales bacterium]
MKNVKFDPAGDLPTFLGNIESAIKEGAKSLLLFACEKNGFTPGLLDSSLRILSVPVSGGIFPGVIFGRKNYDKGSLVVSFPFEAKVAHITGLNAPEMDFSDSVSPFADALTSCPTVLVFVDGASRGIHSFLDDVYDRLGAETKYMGGGAGSQDLVRKPCIFSNQGLVQDQAQLVGIPYSSEIEVSHGWQKFAGPLLVTEAQGEVIRSLDYKPALDVYLEIVKTESRSSGFFDLFCEIVDAPPNRNGEDFSEIARSFPIGMEKNEAFVCESFTREGRTLVCKAGIPCLTPLCILKAEPENLIDASKKASKKLIEKFPSKHTESRPIVFSCTNRNQFLQERFADEVGEIADSFAQFGDPFGALTLGEIASDDNGRLTLFNNSIVLGLPRGKNAPPHHSAVSTQYALATLVRQDPKFIEILRQFLSPALKLLNCGSGHIWLRDELSGEELIHRYSYPAKEFERIAAYPKLAEKIGKLIPPHAEIITENSAIFHLFPIGKTGVLVLRSNAPLPDDMILALSPTLASLENACLCAMRHAYCEKMKAIALQDVSRLLCELETVQESERRLLKSDHKLRFILENIPHFVFWRDLGSVFLGCNRNFARLAGFDGMDEIIGRTDLPWETALLGKDRFVMENDSSMLDSVEPLLLPDGRQIWIRMSKLPMHGHDGKVAGVLTIFEDISDRRRVEEEWRLNGSVFENTREGILITDEENRIINANRSFSEMTGYSREELIGKEPRCFLAGLQDDNAQGRILHAIETTGSWRGELWGKRKDGTPFATLLNISAVRNEQGELTHYVSVFGNITDMKDTEKRLENLAHFDPLTNLPNRTLLAEDLRKAILQADRNGRIFALAFLDLDDFKPVNDQHGHETGDRLLIEVAKRLKRALRGEDSIARLGGDEFVMLLSGIKDMADVELMLNRLLLDLSSPYQVDSFVMRISASIGVTVYPFDRSDADTLLRHADQAMYLAKQSGRNRFQWFDSKLDMELRARQEKLSKLRLALEGHQLALHYQPKINLKTGKVIGLEALIRWQHPEEGLIGPVSFLPLAEQSDLIIKIGDWILEEAVRQMANWIEIGLDFPVSVNISASQLKHSSFVERLKEVLVRYPSVPPTRLEFEILETAALDDLDRVRETMIACQQIGVSFSLDDFGTGYSSLAYLKRLPVDTVKVDKSFVHDMKENMEDLSIIEGVIGLARIFSKMVIAEGVETSEHGMLLVRLGCDFGQGYGIARPMSADEVPKWLAQFNTTSVTN